MYFSTNDKFKTKPMRKKPKTENKRSLFTKAKSAIAVKQ